ncbi:MAG: DUF6456 domain-containing protein [Ahrensia sp.]|nr:DUF6456 domain-containing protein [Ahrensia sp.]
MGKTYISLVNCNKVKVRDAEFSEHAEKHREIHTASIFINGDEHTVFRNINESPLARLYSSKTKGGGRWLESCEFSAGERFRSDFEYAQLGPRITASWDPTSQISCSKGGRRPAETLTDRAMGARIRFNKAVDAVGPELSGVLMDICCFLKGLEQVEMERSWPRRSAKLILKIALSVLARHYEPSNKRPSSAINTGALMTIDQH